MAGLSGDIQTMYSPNIRTNVLSCLGKVEVADLLKALEEGNDGVFLIGCQEDKCQNENGSMRARQRAEYVKRLMDEMGISKERIAVYSLPASEMAKSKTIIEEIRERTKKLGPI